MMATNESTLGAAEALALVVDQQKSVREQMGSFVPLMTAVWGVAYLVGFLGLFLVDGIDPGLPLPVAITLFIVLIVAAGALSTYLGIRSGRGIKQSYESSFTGAVYGMSWSFGSLALAAIGGGLAYQGLSQELANYFYPVIFLFFIGLMYIVAGAIYIAPFSITAGALLVLVAVAALFIEAPWHFLFLSLAGGGTFIALAIVARVRTGGVARGRA